MPVENSQVTIPSAVFFKPKEYHPFYGREAVDLFFSRHPGRFMRSLKRVLGTSVMKHGTMVNGKPLKFEKIIASFLKNLKDKAELFSGCEIDNVVMGRPVHFVDDDTAADDRAHDELRSIAQSVGFKAIEFQFEPIAAAFAHEIKITGEKLALVVDLGGGTSDFTVIRLSNKYVSKTDRSSDILANTGVRVGGNDFDKDLSLSIIMPELGYGSTYGEKKLEVPLKPYHDLAEWSKVNLLYTTKIISQTKQFLHESHDRKRFKRLLTILEQESGHSVLAAAEQTKIALTTHSEFKTGFEFIESDFSIAITQLMFEDAVRDEVNKITRAALRCVTDAAVRTDAIDLIILTGGSTEVPLVQVEFKRLFPNSEFADENKLSSVGLGLAYDSRNRFM